MREFNLKACEKTRVDVIDVRSECYNPPLGAWGRVSLDDTDSFFSQSTVSIRAYVALIVLVMMLILSGHVIRRWGIVLVIVISLKDNK